MKIERIKPRKDMVDQVNEIMAQNKRILAMNERLLAAILNPPHVVQMAPINVDELLRTKP